jgi:hypothetical protein
MALALPHFPPRLAELTLQPYPPPFAEHRACFKEGSDDVSEADDIELKLACEFRKSLTLLNTLKVLPCLIKTLRSDDNPELILKSASALTNITSTNYTKAVVDANAVPVLVKLLSHQIHAIREQSARCLGKIACASPSLRDIILASGAMPPLIENIHSRAGTSLLNTCVWALSNLFRGRPAPELSWIRSAIPILASILEGENEELKIDALWALSYISDGDDNCISAVLEAKLAPILVHLLDSFCARTVAPALLTVGNIVSGNLEHTNIVLDEGLIPKISSLLLSSNVSPDGAN